MNSSCKRFSWSLDRSICFSLSVNKNNWLIFIFFHCFEYFMCNVSSDFYSSLSVTCFNSGIAFLMSKLVKNFRNCELASYHPISTWFLIPRIDSKTWKMLGTLPSLFSCSFGLLYDSGDFSLFFCFCSIVNSKAIVRFQNLILWFLNSLSWIFLNKISVSIPKIWLEFLNFYQKFFKLMAYF